MEQFEDISVLCVEHKNSMLLFDNHNDKEFKSDLIEIQELIGKSLDEIQKLKLLQLLRSK